MHISITVVLFLSSALGRAGCNQRGMPLLVAEEFMWNWEWTEGIPKKKKLMWKLHQVLHIETHPVVLMTNNDITFPRMTTELQNYKEKSC